MKGAVLNHAIEFADEPCAFVTTQTISSGIWVVQTHTVWKT